METSQLQLNAASDKACVVEKVYIYNQPVSLIGNVYEHHSKINILAHVTVATWTDYEIHNRKDDAKVLHVATICIVHTNNLLF